MRFDDYMRVGKHEKTCEDVIETYLSDKELRDLNRKYSLSKDYLIERCILDSDCSGHDSYEAQTVFRAYIKGIKLMCERLSE